MELFGFILASISIALRIGWVKSIADNIKVYIANTHKRYNKDCDRYMEARARFIGTVGNKETVTFWHIVKSLFRYVVIETCRLLGLSVIFGFRLIIIKIQLKRIKVKTRKHPDNKDRILVKNKIQRYLVKAKEAYREYVKAQYEVLVAAYNILPPFIVLMILKPVEMKIVTFITARLIGDEVITKYCIIFGTLLIIIGLILELYSTF